MGTQNAPLLPTPLITLHRMSSHRVRSHSADTKKAREPRRLTEKIAIMKRKEHEQSEAFEKAMKSIMEVIHREGRGGRGSAIMEIIHHTPWGRGECHHGSNPAYPFGGRGCAIMAVIHHTPWGRGERVCLVFVVLFSIFHCSLMAAKVGGGCQSDLTLLCRNHDYQVALWH